MNINTTLRELLSEKEMTIKEVSNLTKIPATTLYSLADKRLDCIRLGVLKKIMEALKIDTEELISAWDEYKDLDLTKEETIITHFRRLNDVGQYKAIEQVEMLTKIPEYQKENNK